MAVAKVECVFYDALVFEKATCARKLLFLNGVILTFLSH